MGINFTNNYNNQYVQNPELQRRLEAGDENFGALDREKLKQDTTQFAEKSKQTMEDNVHQNGYTKLIKSGISPNVKKTIKSILLTIGATVGLAVIGNKSSNLMVKLGLNLDDVLSNNKVYTGIGNFFKKIKTGVGDFLLKSKTIQDVSETLKTRKAKQKNMFARGYGRGIRSIFSLTPPDIMKKGLANLDTAQQKEVFKKLVGNRADELQSLLKNGNDNVEFCNKLTDAIAEHFGNKNAAGVIDHKGLMATFEKIQKGEVAPELVNVVMAEKGGGITRIIGDWWPVNLINAVTRKISGGKIKPIGLGNLGDSLIKYNAVNGSLAKTAPAKVLQQAILDITEMPSNFVNDKSGFGVFLCLSTLPGLFNNVIDAPKEKKIPTVANDFVSSVGSMVVSAPIASGIIYGAASLKNLKGSTIFSKMLKPIGRIAGLGLDRIDPVSGNIIKSSNKIAGFAGGAMRLFAIFSLMSVVSKPLTKIINKIFGKPYDPNEAQKEKQLEQEKNTIVPELGITKGELIDKINKNPQAVQQLQTNPNLVALIQANPKLLVDYLDGKDITKATNQAPSSQNTTNTPNKVVLSPANQALLNRKMSQTNANQAISTPSNQTLSTNKTQAYNNGLNQSVNNSNKELNKSQPTQDDNKPKDTVTYIPSSKFKAKDTNVSSAESQEIQNALDRADKVLAKAEQYL